MFITVNRLTTDKEFVQPDLGLSHCPCFFIFKMVFAVINLFHSWHYLHAWRVVNFPSVKNHNVGIIIHTKFLPLLHGLLLAIWLAIKKKFCLKLSGYTQLQLYFFLQYYYKHIWSDILLWTLKPVDSFGMWWKSNDLFFYYWVIIV